VAIGKKGYKLRKIQTKTYKISYNYINYTINLVGRSFGRWSRRRLCSGCSRRVRRMSFGCDNIVNDCLVDAISAVCLFYHKLADWPVNQMTTLKWVSLQMPTVAQLFKKLPTFYRTRRFITVPSTGLYLDPVTPHSIPLRSILILYSHLRLCLASGLLSWGFPRSNQGRMIICAVGDIFLLSAMIAHLPQYPVLWVSEWWEGRLCTVTLGKLKLY
jgi:hypothetical protein